MFKFTLPFKYYLLFLEFHPDMKSIHDICSRHLGDTVVRLLEYQFSLFYWHFGEASDPELGIYISSALIIST